MTPKSSMKPSLLLPFEIFALLVGVVVIALGIIPLPVLPLFLIGWVSLHLRHMGWRDIGMKRPENWLPTIGLALLIGLGYQVLDTVAISPLLQSLTGQSIDFSQFSILKGSLPALLLFIIISWTEAAFLEEMFFRGYFFNRLTDITGNGRMGVGIALVVSALFFGAGHAYQGITGMADTFMAGLVLGLLYLFARRNLWLPILTHGIIDTIGFIILYKGLFGS
jgi:membrane protease YdiL (CAAX protease family)